MRAKDFVKNNVTYHDSLNPAAWDGTELRSEVRTRLLEIAKVFVGYLEIPDFKVIDVVLTGSMTNYNYTKYSDFDIHVATRYSDLQCDDLAEALYRAKKQIWNDAHDIMIRGHEAELYVEDVGQPPVSGGRYSLLNGTWVEKPKFNPPSVDDTAVNAKVNDLIKQIDSAIKLADDPEDIKRIMDKIRNMRRAGLDRNGEFSVENLSFKILRNMGYISKLSKSYHRQQDIELSL